MKSTLRTAMPLLIAVIVILLASVLPMALFREREGADNSISASPFHATSPVQSEENPVGLDRAKFLARALSTKEKFLYESSEFSVDREQIKSMMEDCFLLFGVPEFMYNELDSDLSQLVIESVDIVSGGGALLPVLHIYCEWEGDWSNWLEIYIDRDLDKIIYFYASGQCVFYPDEYVNGYLDYMGAEEIAAYFAEHSGYSLDGLEYTNNPNENAVEVVYSDTAGSSTSYKINSVYYPGTMYDFKVAPLP